MYLSLYLVCDLLHAALPCPPLLVPFPQQIAPFPSPFMLPDRWPLFASPWIYSVLKNFLCMKGLCHGVCQFILLPCESHVSRCDCCESELGIGPAMFEIIKTIVWLFNVEAFASFAPSNSVWSTVVWSWSWRQRYLGSNVKGRWAMPGKNGSVPFPGEPLLTGTSLKFRCKVP